MRVIELNAKDWSNVLDFYAALKTALGSCPGHGDSPDAWGDSMIYGGMNQIEAPYLIRIVGANSCSADLKSDILQLAELIEEARQERLARDGCNVDIRFQIEP